jgi:hypothetical protein
MSAFSINSGFAHLLLIAAFAAAAVSSAAFNGIPYGNDLTQHYQFAASVDQAIRSGDFYPSVAPAPNNGTGDYGLRFYPPAAYYALALGFEATGGWFSASILVFFVIYFAGGAGVYLWVKEEFPVRQALIAAALFVFAPYHLNQIYNNFLFGEFAVSAVIPFCFLFLHRTAKRPSIGSSAGLAAAYALLILTHLPSLIFCSIAFAAYGLIVLYRSGTFLKGIPALAVAVVSAVAATSFYWIRLVTELDWINHSKAEYFSNIYSYSNNFLLRPQNILNMADDVLAVWIGDLMLAAMVLISIPAAIFLFRRRERMNSLLLGSLVAMGLAIFFSSALSKPLWDNLGFLQKIQFPWRWLGVVSVTGAALASYGIAAASEKMKEGAGAAVTLTIGAGLLVFTVSAVFITKQSVFIPPSEFTNAKVAAMLSAPSRDCWWTVWAKDGFYRTAPDKASAGKRDVRVIKWSSTERQVEFGPGQGSQAVFSVQYYPHWRAYSGNERIDVNRTPAGLVSVKIPESAASVILKFREPDKVRAAAVVSAAAFALILFAALLPLIRGTFRKRSEESMELSHQES